MSSYKANLKVDFKEGCLVVSIVIGLYVSIMSVLLSLMMLMFEYSLLVFVGKDVPWYLDLMGGLVLNATNLPIWVFSLIYSFLYEVPIFVV